MDLSVLSARIIYMSILVLGAGEMNWNDVIWLHVETFFKVVGLLD